jgi:hypothetical protein
MTTLASDRTARVLGDERAERHGRTPAPAFDVALTDADMDVLDGSGGTAEARESMWW